MNYPKRRKHMETPVGAEA